MTIKLTAAHYFVETEKNDYKIEYKTEQKELKILVFKDISGFQIVFTKVGISEVNEVFIGLLISLYENGML